MKDIDNDQLERLGRWNEAT